MAKSVDAPCFDGIVCIGQPVPHVHSIIPVLLRAFIPIRNRAQLMSRSFCLGARRFA
jgi:hypothetical protein